MSFIDCRCYWCGHHWEHYQQQHEVPDCPWCGGGVCGKPPVMPIKREEDEDE